MLEESVFQDCLDHWRKSDGFTSFWDLLANKYSFQNGERLRQEFNLDEDDLNLDLGPLGKLL